LIARWFLAKTSRSSWTWTHMAGGCRSRKIRLAVNAGIGRKTSVRTALRKCLMQW